MRGLVVPMRARRAAVSGCGAGVDVAGRRGRSLRPFVFGRRPVRGGQHRGIDIGGAVGEAVRAPTAGRSSFAGSVPAQRVSAHDPHGRRLLRHADASRLDRGAARATRSGRARASARSERAPTRGRRAVRAPRRPADRDEDGYLDPLRSCPRGRRVAVPAPAARGGAAVRCRRSPRQPRSARRAARACRLRQPLRTRSAGRPAPRRRGREEPAVAAARAARRRRRAAGRAATPAAAPPHERLVASRATVAGGRSLAPSGRRHTRTRAAASRARRTMQASSANGVAGSSARAPVGAQHARRRLGGSASSPRPSPLPSRAGDPSHPRPSAAPARARRCSTLGARRGRRVHGHAKGTHLPLMAMRFYVTTPIYYVNSTPHIGHAYTTIAADILARHHRQRGEDTFFLTGVDEHADKVARVAAEQGLDAAGVRRPDRREPGRSCPGASDAEHDFFIRTSDEGHKRFVQDFLAAHLRRTATSTRTSTRACTASGCEAFKTEDELVDGKCPIHGHGAGVASRRRTGSSGSPPTRTGCSSSTTSARTSSFRASATTRRGASSPAGLRDFSHQPRGADVGRADPVGSRAGRVRLGGRARQLPERAELRARARTSSASGPTVRHLLGKDILRFHCVFWPALLLSAGYEPPKQLFVHGYLLSTTARCRSRSATSSTRSSSSTSTASTPCASTLRARRPSARTATSRSTTSASATSASSPTTSATSSRARRR